MSIERGRKSTVKAATRYYNRSFCGPILKECPDQSRLKSNSLSSTNKIGAFCFGFWQAQFDWLRQRKLKERF